MTQEEREQIAQIKAERGRFDTQGATQNISSKDIDSSRKWAFSVFRWRIEIRIFNSNK